MDEADAIVVGAGLAGLVAACELADAGKRVTIVDQEGEQSLGGQAFWSLGGIFLVDSPEQRRMRIRDSFDLALEDWMGTAAFDRPEDEQPRKWAEAYVAFAAGEKRAWLYERGVRFFPLVGWAERGGGNAIGHGNSVPRFHIAWGTGPGVVAPFVDRVREAAKTGLVTIKCRHRVDELVKTGGRIDGVRGAVLEPTNAERGAKTSRATVGSFELKAQAVIVASGGIGGDHELVRRNWPKSLGQSPRRMIAGVPDHVDGRMLAIAEGAGGRIINPDRMWHYVEGIKNWNPIWTNHAIRILPGPSSLWLDAHKSWRRVAGRLTKGAPAPVQAFMDKGEDFIVEKELPRLVERMNALAGGPPLLTVEGVEHQIRARDRQLDNPFCKDIQITAIRGARAYLGDKLMRTARPHKLLDPAAGPLIAVRLNVLTRKTLGGLETDLESRALGPDGAPVPGLYAAGEAAGFGGGGMHGYAALEGTFLGGCIFSGRAAGRAAARAAG
jgi:uncharacterized protein